MRDNINILTELREAGSTILLNVNRSNLYFIPADYFNSLPENLLSLVFVESIPRINPYAVPAGYFERFPEIVLEKVSVRENVPALNGIGEMPYSVPNGYFEGFAQNVLKKIESFCCAVCALILAKILPARPSK